MSIIESIVLAIVEGLTEFLPVSSTGHLIIVQNLLGIETTPFVKAYTVIIQFGASLSVVVLYWKHFFRIRKYDETAAIKESGWILRPPRLRSFLYRYDFYWKLLIAFIPAAVIGFLSGDIIDDMLESVFIVALMLVIGGVVMIFADRRFSRTDKEQRITESKALKIGLFQCIAMIPGVSRSMATIVGGMAQRLNRKKAAEFSFFLAVPTMFAATLYKIYKLLSMEGGMHILRNNAAVLITGNIVAFIVAILAIRLFISYVTKYGFRAFGYYRIAVGGLILVLMALDFPLVMV